MKKFRVGIIGTGFGAKVHAPLLNHHDGFEVVAIASVSRGNVEEAKKVSGVDQVYTDWRQMVENESLDFVVVASAVHLHKEMVAFAYEKGIHVLCEKPMALDANETAEMISIRDQSGKVGLLNHEFRFLPARTKVKEIVDSGALGEMIHIRYQGTFPSYTSLISRSRGWLGQSETGGGMLGAIGSHMIDTLQWWTSNTFKSVFANLPIHVPLYTDEGGNEEHRTADDAFQVIGNLDGGATVTLELVTAANQAAHTYRLEIFGTNGTLVMLDDANVQLSLGDEPLQEVELIPAMVAPSEIPPIAARYYNAYNRMLDALYETFANEKKHPYLADFEDGHRTQRVLDAIRSSAKEGKKVEVN